VRPALLGIALFVGCGGPADPGPVCEDPPRGPAWAQFADVTRESGIEFEYETPDFKGGGLAVADLDNDGLPEIIAGSRLGGLGVFRNRGGMRFEPADVGIDPALEVSAIAAADLDNDDDQDLVLAGHGSAKLYANQGDGTFVEAATLADTGSTEHVLPVDLDGDGRLDLYFGNYDLQRPPDTLNRVFMNQGALQFAFAGTAGAGQTWTSTAFDIDDDGDLDLYVANDTLAYDFGDGPVAQRGATVDLVLRNDGMSAGMPTLVDVAADYNLDEARSSMSGLLGDFDEDGLLDLFVTNWGAKKLYVRTPLGSYVERGVELGVAGIGRTNARCVDGTDAESCLLLSWAAALSDFDLDGHEELIVVNGETEFGRTPPVLVYTRGPTGTYTEAATDIPCQDSRGMIVTDLDGDGDQDVVTAPKSDPLSIYKNLTTPEPHTYLRLQLRGQISNRDGRGAVVTLRLQSGRTLTRVVGSGGVLHSSGPAEAFFGLGDEIVEELRIKWPTGRIATTTSPFGSLVISEDSIESL
jgi:enediyne biosynthesis protein E4